MRYARIRNMDISNGEGIGVALFVQGCHFHCQGCFNPETWDFNGGKEWNDEIYHSFLKLISKPYIKRVTILGGEPLCDENVADVLELIDNIKNIYPKIDIWMYTGYSFDTIVNKAFITDNEYDLLRCKCVLKSDVLVDGQFELENQDLFNKKTIWAGSTNQNIIRIKEKKNMLKLTIQ